MTITIDVPPGMETFLLTQARAKGMTVEQLLQNQVVERALQSKVSFADWERELDGLLDTLPPVPSLPDEALDRGTMYRD